MSTNNNSTALRHTPLILLIVATLFCLVPFVGKAFNIDEPLFIWAARQIQIHPLDFYGFTLNWYGVETSAAEIIKNPPLASYYIAMAGGMGGWSEISLHTAFLVPAVVMTAGTYVLAAELSRRPWMATLISIFTPVFIMSSATVMCDTLMMALYVWAVFLWLRGVKCDSSWDLFFASLLIALCSLTKYFGISLMPLLFLYTLCSRHGQKRRVLFLLVPVAILCLYQWRTTLLYGSGLLLDAVSYAASEKKHGIADVLSSLITGLSFLGGCLLPTLLFMPLLWGKRAVFVAVVAVPLFALGLSQLSFPERYEVSWEYYLQLSLFVVAGMHLLALTAHDVWTKRDAESLLLFWWIMGTFVFASFINWSVNGRSILPVIPAVGILMVRALDRRGYHQDTLVPVRARTTMALLMCAYLVSMLVAWSDYSFAGTARGAARDIAQQYAGVRGQPLIFQGHWGFQYYLEQKGALAFNMKKEYKLPLIMAVPENSTNNDLQIMEKGSPLQLLTLPTAHFLTTMNSQMRAGFYSSQWGALPFAFGPVPDEKYLIVQFK